MNAEHAVVARYWWTALTRLLLAVVVACPALFWVGGCTSNKAAEGTSPTGTPLADYSRPLPPGRSALRLLHDPRQVPDFSEAYRTRDPLLLQSIDRSIAWFDKPSSRNYFPFEGITHDQARASLVAMRHLLESATSESEFLAEFRRLFDVYQSIGYDGSGTVLYTGYFAPILNASPVQTANFDSPLYTRPPDLVTDTVSGTPLGRKSASGQVVPYYTRKEIEETRMLAGSELVWLEDPLAAYIVHVNGSAKLRLPDGSPMYVGYAGKTDQPYASLGRALIEAGLIEEGGASLSSIKQAFRQYPQQVRELMYRNENFVFFQQYPEDNWPAGSLGFPVTAERSLATDKTVYPRGGMVIVNTEAQTFSRGKKQFFRFMLDQDTGGAIKAPGRADIFMGVGPMAEILAGGQYAEGALYYTFLKPQFVGEYLPEAPQVAGAK